MRKLITCLLLLILQPILANASPLTRPTMQEWYQLVKVCAKEFNLDPNLCAALAAGESGIGGQEVRFCWVSHGKYLAPYNLHKSVVKRYGVTDWKSCTKVGIMLLANKLEKYGSLWAALRHYNTDDGPREFEGYYNNIKRLKRWYEKRRVFDDNLVYLGMRKKLFEGLPIKLAMRISR